MTQAVLRTWYECVDCDTHWHAPVQQPGPCGFCGRRGTVLRGRPWIPCVVSMLPVLPGADARLGLDTWRHTPYTLTMTTTTQGPDQHLLHLVRDELLDAQRIYESYRRHNAEEARLRHLMGRRDGLLTATAILHSAVNGGDPEQAEEAVLEWLVDTLLAEHEIAMAEANEPSISSGVDFPVSYA